ncbi:pyridoxamine 5'-phosphate oxidase family protein [Streptomyces chiangmaiensis]|uniref:Pyridoxamine 5'-phosphate oxidase family protein n=1 Tax=Streptomyces chiangmaiensis TaxID=766497 RepID=A0ABU7FER2_9ACTN|nr:pyridoxamine 5'-phosphate oxidase family protein [Streptomyces chiangmaiensis]MED7822385.1 pyridoxamine 5'-phosphate oxidase family protein [Streptomyces chiangmaiensis]
MVSKDLAEVTSLEQLGALLGEPTPAAADKVRTSLHEHDKQWLAASPFCLVSTSAADGSCDTSPKGDPAGFTLVLDDTTIAIPDRPGNRRGDGFRNILSNPQVGLLYLIPGRSDTLRINGRARILQDAPFFDQMVVKGNRPKLALLIEVGEVFYHCPKALLRAGIWKTESWNPDAAPSRSRIAKALEHRPESLEELDRYYGPRYGERLYG